MTKIPSRRTIKTIVAANNSVKHLGSVAKHEYTSVDGRTYIPEAPLPDTAPDTKHAYKHIGAGWPSLIEVYRCLFYLRTGNRYLKNYLTAGERDATVKELSLVYDETKGRYTTSHEALWEYFQTNFKAQLERHRITSYGELAYRARYGSR